MIRVLQLGSSSGLYGAERWIITLIRNLSSDRFETWVGSFKENHGCDVPLCNEAKTLGFKTVEFECFGRINVSAINQLRCFIEKNKIDILHTHGYKTDLIGLVSCAGTPCKVVSTPHGWTKNPDLKLRFYEIMDRFMFPFCDAVVPLSTAMAEGLGGIPGIAGKLHMIENGVDTDEIEAVVQVHEQMVRWKDDGASVAGYIGRLISGKGIECLLSALSSPGMERWRLALVGDGPQREEFGALASRLGLDNRVTFFGFRPDRLSFLKGFDAFVLPSESEGIPRCLMEAMAAKVPVVASDIPGCRFLVDHGNTGLLFETNNAGLLAEALHSLVADPALACRLAEAGHAHIMASFSGRRMAAEYTRLYERLLAAQSIGEVDRW